MNRAFAVGATVALLCTGGVARADVFNLGPGLLCCGNDSGNLTYHICTFKSSRSIAKGLS